MRYALALLGLIALVNAFVISQSPGPDWAMTLMVGLVVLAAVFLTAAVIVARLDRVIRLLKAEGRE